MTLLFLAAHVSENRHYETPPLHCSNRPRLVQGPQFSGPHSPVPSGDRLQQVPSSSHCKPVFEIGEDALCYLSQSSASSGSIHSDISIEFSREDFRNNNELLQKDCCLESLAPGPDFIQWPVNNNLKSDRVSAVRQQVEHFSKVIKMTIDDGPDGASPPMSPFSSYVDFSALRNHIRQSESLQPTWPEIENLLSSGKLKEAKILIRTSDWSADDPIRGQLWKELIKYHSKEEFSDIFFWDQVKNLYGATKMSECNVGLPNYLDPNYASNHCLSSDATITCWRVTSVIGYTYPAITFAPMVYPIAAALLHYMGESDAFNCLSTILNSPTEFIFQTRSKHEVMWKTVEALARKHVKVSFSMLDKYHVTDEQIDEGFQGWIWWILVHLPFSHLVRIIDCYLFEGSKVLLRCSLAVFHLFMKNISRDDNRGGSLAAKGIDEAIAYYCNHIDVPPSKLLKTAFGIRAFSRADILKTVAEMELHCNSEGAVGGYDFQQPAGGPSPRQGLPSGSPSNFKRSSHTLSIKEGEDNPLPLVDMGRVPLAKLDSGAATMEELIKMWSWIPTRMTMKQPTLIYTTEEDGSSITTFYKKVEMHVPTIILVRTLKDDVFGACLSYPLKERHVNDAYGNRQTYFGTGETFIFTLRPKAKKYQWAGDDILEKTNGLGPIPHEAQLYIHADNDMFCIGGGGGHAIMLDRDLQWGKSEHCETYDNEPLTSESQFDIKVIEVFALQES